MGRYIFLIFFFLCVSCSSSKIDEIHYIKKDFTGAVYILYNQEDGFEEFKTDNGSTIYTIPKSGILKTKGKLISGVYSDKNVKFFYIDSSGNTEQLFFKKPGDFSSDSVVVFPFSVSSARIEGKDFPQIMQYYVGIPIYYNPDSIKPLTLKSIENWKN